MEVRSNNKGESTPRVSRRGFGLALSAKKTAVKMRNKSAKERRLRNTRHTQYLS